MPRRLQDLGKSGFQRGERGVNGKLGQGFREKASIDRTIDQLLWTPAPKAPKVIFRLKMVNFFFHQIQGK